MSDETCFIKDNKTNTTPNENTKYNCRILLRIQSVYYSMKGKVIKYYPPVLLEQCGYRVFSNNKLIHPDLTFTDSEPDESDESEEMTNENTV